MKKVLEDVTPKGGVVEGAADPPKGRAGMLAAYKQFNEGAADDTGDEELYDFGLGRMSSLEEKYKGLSEPNSRLAELVAKDPKLAVVLSLISGENPRSLPYSVAKVYGKDFLSLEGEGLEDFEKGYQEQLSALAENNSQIEAAKKNIEEYEGNLERFASENGLREEEVAKLSETIYGRVMDMLNGIIPVDFIESMWKGMNYDKDVQDAADTGVVEGANKKIEAQMRNVSTTAPVGGVSRESPAGGAGGEKRGALPKSKNGSFWDEVKDV